MRTTLVVSDVQHPFNDKSMTEKLLMVAEDMQPDAVILIGDAVDFKEISRWSIGTAELYKPTLGQNITGFRRDVLVPLRAAVGNLASITWLEGNHDKRMNDFVTQYGWPLHNVDQWDTGEQLLGMDNLFGLKNLGVQYVKGPKDIGNDVIMTHGHELGSYASTLSAWDAKFGKSFGNTKSVIFGHTHQPGIITRGVGHGGELTNSWVMNVGSIMDTKQVDYMASGSMNWTHSFGVLYEEDGITFPALVIANKGRFHWNGYTY